MCTAGINKELGIERTCRRVGSVSNGKELCIEQC